jgi:hypothetical protein
VSADFSTPVVEAPTGRHAIDVVTARQELDVSVREVRDLFGSLTVRVADAVDILRTYRHDDEARQAALAVLTGEPQ